MTARDDAVQAIAPFSEKGFYLSEFRGRTLAISVASSELRERAALREVLADLAANETRVILVSDHREALAELLDTPAIAADEKRLEGAIWQGLRKSSVVGVYVGAGDARASATRRVALRLGRFKLVWSDERGALEGEGGRRLSFVDL